MLTIKDAKLEDFCEFFTVDVTGITCRPDFERFLNKKRFRFASIKVDAAIKREEEANDLYIAEIKKLASCTTPEEKLQVLNRAMKYGTQVEYWQKEYEKWSKQMDRIAGVGGAKNEID